jgi:hypothetical protein
MRPSPIAAPMAPPAIVTAALATEITVNHS